MSELNTHEFPAGGGWVFRQPQTGWTNPYAMVGYKASVDAIIKHRQANKAVTLKFGLSLDRTAVEQELMKYTRSRLGIPDPQPSFFQVSRGSSQPVGLAAAAANIKRAAKGTGVILDWLMSGGAPVAKELAESRASVCVNCPKNVDGSWYTTAPAELIKNTLEARKDLTLATSKDISLKSCDVCKCLMRLKVWVPLEHIVNHTTQDVLAEFPPNCWIARRDT